jgi:hypothetical protein
MLHARRSELAQVQLPLSAAVHAAHAFAGTTYTGAGC